MEKKMISEDAILAVKRGIYWLDENHPGWAERIDLSQLNMAECTECVIGQAVGDYSATIAEQALDYPDTVIWATEHGFESPLASHYMTCNPAPVTYSYFELDTLWAEEVKSRLGD